MIKVLNRNDEVVCVLQNDESQESCPYWDDLGHDKLNDSYSTFEFKTVADHEYSNFLIEENKIAVQDLDGITRLYRIKVAQDEGEGEQKSRYIFAENEALEMLGSWVRPQTLAGQTAVQALTKVLEETRWQVGTVEWTGINSIVIDNYMTVIEAIHKIRSHWGSDLQYRVEIKNSKIVGRYVDFPEMVGVDDGKRFEYAKDLAGMTRRVSTEELATAMIGIGASNEDKTFVTIAPVSWSPNTGDPASKPAGQDWVGDEGALAQWGTDGRHIFGVYRDTEEKDPEKLMTKTWNALQKRKIPNVTFEADVLLIMRMVGFSHERVGLGDTVRIKDNTYEPPLLLEARVIEFKWSLSDETKDSVVIGDYRPQLTSTYASIKAIQNIIQINEGAWNAETKTYTSDTPPLNPEPDTLWLDTSGAINILKRFNSETGTWEEVGPTTAEEIGAATTEEVQAAQDLAKKATSTSPHVTIKTPIHDEDYSEYAHGLLITVDEDVHLGYASVYANVAGTFVVQLRLPDYTILEEKWYNLEIGENRINLDFLLDKETKDFMLFGDAVTARTARTLPAGVVFPYDSGTIHVTGSTSGEGYWYHFYKIGAAGAGVIGDIVGTIEGTDVTVVKETADTAKSTADTANTTAGQAKTTAETANSTANTANQTANTANQTANTANQTANLAWGKFSGAGNTLPAGNVEFNFAGSTTKGGNANNTNAVGTQTATTVQNVSINFNARNDRISTIPANPTILSDGTAIDHVINKDGSSDISFEWGFTGTGNAYDIDGFIVYVRASTSSAAYTFGTTPGDEQVYYVTPEKRAFILYGTAADKYYTFGVQAYRGVDDDINTSGFLKSSIVKSTATGENPYRPSSTVAFAGEITGTINGKTPAQVTAQEQAAKDAVQNGQVTLPTGMLSGDINPDQNAIISNNSKISWSSNGIVVSDPTGATQVSSMTKDGFNAKNGAFTLEDPNTGLKYSLEDKQNLIFDHSFELLEAGTGISGAGGYYSIVQSSESGSEDNWERWWSINARLKSVYNTDNRIMSPFGSQSVAVNNSSYIRQSIDVTENRTFTISAHFFAPNFTQSATGMPRIQIDFLKTYQDGTGAEITTNLGAFSKDGAKPLNDYLSPERLAITVTAPPVGSLTGFLHYRMRVTIIGQNTYWVECDGVQVVENDLPVQYQPENELWMLRRGSSGGKSYVPFIKAPEKNAEFNSVKTWDRVYMQGNGQVGDLIGTDTSYLGLYPVGAGGGRKAWLGYGSTTALQMKIYSYHNIELQPNGGSRAFIFDQVTNGGINFGAAKLKFLSSSGGLQSRNEADTAYEPISASAFTVNSDPQNKLNVQPYTTALEKIKNTPVYQYQLSQDFDIYEEIVVEDVVKDRNGNIIDRHYRSEFKVKPEKKKPEQVKVRTGLMLTEAPEELVVGDGVDLYAMNSMLWKAVQELTARVEILENIVRNQHPPTTPSK